MAKLTALTDRSAVVAAMQEFQSLGRAAFLAEYGFDESRDYFLHYDGQLYDTKPLVSAAVAVQHPSEPRLGPKAFSGGAAGAVRALERLGFSVVTRAQMSPPKLGSEFADRTAVYDAYGGDKVAGIIRFPGEVVVNVFSDASAPYADDAPTLTEPFGYRGEGLNGPQHVDTGGNALLERARLSGEAVRFWYRPLGDPFTFLGWATVLGRSWVAGQGQDGLPRPELEWRLQVVPSPNPSEWPTDVTDTRRDAAKSTESSPDGAEASPASSYGDLLARVDELGQSRRKGGVVRTNFARSSAARRAVLLRSGGTCESPGCTGMPAELNRRGEPILDVDHIKDLALGGIDHPLNMVAVCPNCHAIKTRGANTAHYRRELLKAAQQAHQIALGLGI